MAEGGQGWHSVVASLSLSSAVCSWDSVMIPVHSKIDNYHEKRWKKGFHTLESENPHLSHDCASGVALVSFDTYQS